MQALPQQISLLTANFKYVCLLTRPSLFQFLCVCGTCRLTFVGVCFLWLSLFAPLDIIFPVCISSYLWVKSLYLYISCLLSLSRRSRSSWLHEISRKSSHPWDFIIYFILWSSIWIFQSPPVSSSQFLSFLQLLYFILGGWSACQQRNVAATAVPL